MTIYGPFSEIVEATTEAIPVSPISSNAPTRLFWYVPPVVMAARVHMPGTSTYPIQNIPYDGVTTGSYTDCESGMFFTLGSAPGLDDYGRGRLRAAPTNSVIKVGRASQGFQDGELNVVDNAYITVYEDWRVHAKIPVIQSDGTQLKDTDVAVGDNYEFPPPVANTGPSYARTVDPDTGTITVFLPGSTSFAVADGATITSYLWNVKDGTILFGGTSVDDDIYVSFPAGFRWVSLTVTDSNGKSHVARCPIYAHSEDNDLCVPMQVENITRGWQGQTATVRLLEDLPRSQYADGAFVMLWDDVDATPEMRTHMRHIGWHQSDNASTRATETGLLRDTTLTLVDVAGRLQTLPGFPQTIEIYDPEFIDEDNPLSWAMMTTPNMDKYIHYLLHWHSTALDVADYFPSGTGTEYPFVIFDSAGSSLYEQVQRQATRIVPDHNFTCNRRGQLQVIVDPQLQNTEDRTSTVQATFTEQWWSELQFSYLRPPRVNTLYGSALLTQDAWIEVDEDTLVTNVYSIAPGTAPGQGIQTVTHMEQLAKSQEDLNDVTGHRYARLNARYGPITIAPPVGDDQDIEPADMTWVNLVATSSTAPHRGLDFETIRCLPIQVVNTPTYTETGVTWSASVTLELETIGLPALTNAIDDSLDVGEQPPPAPALPTAPDFGLIGGQENVAGVSLDGYVYRTSDFQTLSGAGGPTWDRVDTGITETIYTFVVDPFSPGYINGAGTIDGWVATEDAIYRVADLFGTVTTTAVHTFATNAVAANYHWRSIQASFGAFFTAGDNPWLLCISYYGSTGGHTGTWATHSLDGGTTWSTEVPVSAYYNSGTPAHFNAIGVYTSPKTPGLAYTAAYQETGDPALAAGYMSTDWGETWTKIETIPEDNVDQPLPAWWIWDDPDEVGTVPIFRGYSNKGKINAVVYSETNLLSVESDAYLFLAPPANTKRIVIDGGWRATRGKEDTLGTSTVNIQLDDASSTVMTHDFLFTLPPTNDATSQGFSAEITFASYASQDWPGNRDHDASDIEADLGKFIRARVTAQAVQAGGQWNSASGQITLTVSEIELDDGTIYTPPNGTGFIDPGYAQLGSIHVPWPDNDDESVVYHGYMLTQDADSYSVMAIDGSTVTDISPLVSGRSYGVNRYSFTIRTHDSNRQYVLLSAIANDLNNASANNQHAIFVSGNYGATWSTIVAPVVDSEAPAGRPAFEAAFGGNSEQIIFLWGKAAYISYSSDMGATVDSRAGNLGTLGADAFIGIAGGAS
jgi:hypothetical protein